MMRWAPFLLLSACNSTVGTVSPQTVGDACTNLQKLGCPLGADARCEYLVQQGVSQNHVSLSEVQCASTALTKTKLSACGHYFSCP